MSQIEKSTNVHFGTALSELMDRRGYDNDVALARLIGVSPTAIGNYRKGRVPNGETLVALAKALETTAEYLVTGKALATNSALQREVRRSGVTEEAMRLAAQTAEMLVKLQDELKKLA